MLPPLVVKLLIRLAHLLPLKACTWERLPVLAVLETLELPAMLGVLVTQVGMLAEAEAAVLGDG